MPDRIQVSLLLLTYNRLGFLRKCLASVLERTDVPFEVILWDNGSTDGTSEWLATVTDPRVRVISCAGNLGMNGYPLAAMLASGEYLCEIDDDILELPERWTSRMLEAFRRVSNLGYLALDVVQDEKTDGAKPPADRYRALDAGAGVVLELGPVGGWCTMTPHRIYDEVGGFPFHPGRKYFLEDAHYFNRLCARNYACAILAGVRCYHACGPVWNAEYAEYWKEKYEGFRAHPPAS